MAMQNVSCPECGADIEIEITRERYGEDADGNRGTWLTNTEVIQQDCDCNLSDEAIDNLAEGNYVR